MSDPIRLYEWIHGRFLPGSTEATAVIDLLGPRIDPLFGAGARVLDLCCGAGVWSLWLSERGARVEGVDIAPHMISAARSTAEHRGDDVTFVLGDVAQRDHGHRRFDLAILMGNSIADLPHRTFEQVANQVRRALVARGRLVIHYLDGETYLAEARSIGRGVEQEEPELITWDFREHCPADRSWVATYTNRLTGERFDYTTYIHTQRSIRLALESGYDLERTIPLTEHSYLDVWLTKP